MLDIEELDFRSGSGPAENRYCAGFVSSPRPRNQLVSNTGHWSERGIAEREPHAVRTVLEDVHFGRHLRLAQRHVEPNAVFGDDARVGVGVEEERRRCLRRDVQLVRHQLDQFRIRVLAEQVADRPGMGHAGFEGDHRIAEDEEVGPAAGAIDRVGRRGVAGVESCAGGCREVSSGREAHQPDAGGVDAVLLRPRADQPQSALRIAELDG